MACRWRSRAAGVRSFSGRKCWYTRYSSLHLESRPVLTSQGGGATFLEASTELNTWPQFPPHLSTEQFAGGIVRTLREREKAGLAVGQLCGGSH